MLGPVGIWNRLACGLFPLVADAAKEGEVAEDGGADVAGRDEAGRNE